MLHQRCGTYLVLALALALVCGEGRPVRRVVRGKGKNEACIADAILAQNQGPAASISGLGNGLLAEAETLGDLLRHWINQ